MKLLFVKTRVLPPSTTFDGLLPREIIIQSINDFSLTGDCAYEISFLEVYPPISLIGLGASLPQPWTPKCLNSQTLIAILGTKISLFAD